MADRRPTAALRAAGACAALLAIAWALTFGSGAIRWLDAAALQGFTGLDGPAIDQISLRLAGLANPFPFALIASAILLVSLARGRLRLAAVIPLVLLGANLTTQVLKPLLADPRVCHCLGDNRVMAASWPSGHATAAMALALCAVLVAPARWRPSAAVVGTAFVVAVSYSLLIAGWHYPSDVVGGFLVAAMWTLLGLAAMWAADTRWPARSGREAAVRWGSALAPAAVAVMLATAAAAVVVLSAPERVAHYAHVHTTFVAAAAVIPAVAAAVAGAFVAALRR